MKNGTEADVYEQPPVIQRTFTILADMKPEIFFEKEAEFKAFLQEEQLVYEPRTHWNIELIDKQGRPDVKYQVRIGHSFHKMNSKGDKLLGIEYEEGRIAFSLYRTREGAYLFQDLYDKINKWLPGWWSIFGVEQKSVKVISLDYVNMISRQTTPDFISSEGAVMIGRLLTVFAGVPGNHEGLIPPYDCHVGIAIDKAQGIFL